MKRFFTFFLILFSVYTYTQEEAQIKSSVSNTINELREFVAIPNDALDHADINRNITWLTNKFNERGFNSTVLPLSLIHI